VIVLPLISMRRYLMNRYNIAQQCRWIADSLACVWSSNPL